jgi:hypothetical protein
MAYGAGLDVHPQALVFQKPSVFVFSHEPSSIASQCRWRRGKTDDMEKALKTMGGVQKFIQNK